MFLKRCVNPVSTEAFDIFCQGEDLESCGFSWGDLLEDPGDLLDCDPGTRMAGLVVFVVTDVLVTLSSVIEFCDDVSVESDWELVEPQSSSFSKKRSLDRADLQEEIRFEGSPVARLLQLRRCSGKRKWRYKEVAGVLEKERLLQEWRTT